MGTTISDYSHFTTFSRSFLLCQATVIVAGFLPWWSDLRLPIRKFYPDPSCLACYGQAFRMSVWFFTGIASRWGLFADEALFRHSSGLHCCFPSNVTHFRLAPYFVPESFRRPEPPDFLSAVKLNFPKNILRWMAFDGCLWFYPLVAGSGSWNNRVSPSDPPGGSIKFRSTFPYFRELPFIAYLIQQIYIIICFVSSFLCY